MPRNSGRRAHPRLIDKALGRGIDGSSFTAGWGVYVQRALAPCPFGPWHRNLIIDRPRMVGEQIFGAKYALEIEQTAEKIGLTAGELAGDHACCLHQPLPAHMLAVKGLLGSHQLIVKLGERQPCRQNRMLNVVKPVVAADDASALADPAFRPGIGCVDTDVDDFGQLQPPFADDAEPLAVPFGIGDQIYQDIDPERAREFQCLEIATERDPLAEFLQSLLIDRFDPEKHVFEPELLPEAKDFLMAQQHIAAGFEVIPFLDAGTGDGLADLHPVPLLQKSDIVDDKDTRLPDRPQILDRLFRRDQPIAPAIKGPGAAKRAIPRTAARKLDRGTGVEGPEKIFPAMAQQIACRCQIIERMDKAGWWS